MHCRVKEFRLITLRHQHFNIRTVSVKLTMCQSESTIKKCWVATIKLYHLGQSEEITTSSSSEEYENKPRHPEVTSSLWSSSSDEDEQKSGRFETWPSSNQRQPDLNLQLINRVCILLFSHIQCNTEHVNKSGKIFSHTWNRWNFG